MLWANIFPCIEAMPGLNVKGSGRVWHNERGLLQARSRQQRQHGAISKHTVMHGRTYDYFSTERQSRVKCTTLDEGKKMVSLREG